MLSDDVDVPDAVPEAFRETETGEVTFKEPATERSKVDSVVEDCCGDKHRINGRGISIGRAN